MIVCPGILTNQDLYKSSVKIENSNHFIDYTKWPIENLIVSTRSDTGYIKVFGKNASKIDRGIMV